MHCFDRVQQGSMRQGARAALMLLAVLMALAAPRCACGQNTTTASQDEDVRDFEAKSRAGAILACRCCRHLRLSNLREAVQLCS